jgi:hypothetical protein
LTSNLLDGLRISSEVISKTKDQKIKTEEQILKFQSSNQGCHYGNKFDENGVGEDCPAHAIFIYVYILRTWRLIVG